MDNLSGWYRYVGYDFVLCLDWMFFGFYIFCFENCRYKWYSLMIDIFVRSWFYEFWSRYDSWGREVICEFLCYKVVWSERWSWFLFGVYWSLCYWLFSMIMIFILLNYIVYMVIEVFIFDGGRVGVFLFVL